MRRMRARWLGWCRRRSTTLASARSQALAWRGRSLSVSRVTPTSSSDPRGRAGCPGSHRPTGDSPRALSPVDRGGGTWSWLFGGNRSSPGELWIRGRYRGETFCRRHAKRVEQRQQLTLIDLGPMGDRIHRFRVFDTPSHLQLSRWDGGRWRNPETAGCGRRCAQMRRRPPPLRWATWTTPRPCSARRRRRRARTRRLR